MRNEWLGEDGEGEGRILRLQPSWRHAWAFLLLFLAASLIAVSWSHKYSFFTLTNAFEILGFEFALSFPLLIIVPGAVLCRAFFHVYNKYATMSDKYLRLHTGVLTMNSKVVEMETDTMLVVQVSQSPIDKIFNIGTLSIGRFSRRNFEVNIPGVRNPHKLLRVMKKRIKAARARKAKMNHDLLKGFVDEFEDGMEGE